MLACMDVVAGVWSAEVFNAETGAGPASHVHKISMSKVVLSIWKKDVRRIYFLSRSMWLELLEINGLSKAEICKR